MASVLSFIASSLFFLAANSELQRAIDLINQMEDQQAVLVLEHELEKNELSPTEQAPLHLYLGIAYFNLLQAEKGEREFKQALQADPRITLPPQTAPKIIQSFNEQKRALASIKTSPAVAKPQPATAPPSTTVAESTKTPLYSPTTTQSAPVEHASDKPINWPAWGLLGTAGIAGTVGIILGVLAKRGVERANDLGMLYPQAKDDYDAALNNRLAANVCFGVSAVAALAGVVLLYFPLGNEDDDRATISVSPKTRGLLLQFSMPRW